MQFNHHKLKAARCIKGYSVEEVARRMGVDVHAYWRIESGKTQLKVPHFIKIASILDQPLTYFLDENELIIDVTDRVNELSVILERLNGTAKIQYRSLLQSLVAICET